MSLAKKLIYGAALTLSLALPSKAEKYVIDIEDLSTQREHAQEYADQLKTTYGYAAFVREEFDKESKSIKYATSITTTTALSPEKLEEQISKEIYRNFECKVVPFQQRKDEWEIKRKVKSLMEAVIRKDAKDYLAHFNDPVYLLGKRYTDMRSKEVLDGFQEGFEKRKPISCDTRRIEIVGYDWLKRTLEDSLNDFKFPLRKRDYGVLFKTKDPDCFKGAFFIFRKEKGNWEVVAQ